MDVILDSFGIGSEPQGGHCLFQLGMSRGDTEDDESATVAS